MNKTDYTCTRRDHSQVFAGIEDQVVQFGPWYLLLRAHDHIWNDRGWPFRIRYEAAHLLWELDSTFFVGAA
jgi:hypothetical protein